jgi:hypothetical protein
MKQTVTILVTLSVMAMSVGCKSADVQPVSVDYTSVEAFFRMADEYASGIEPTEAEWDSLFATGGYGKIIKISGRREMIRRAIPLAFDPSRRGECDSLLATDLNPRERNMIENYIAVRETEDALKQQLTGFDFAGWFADGRQRLREFLVRPVDSLIKPFSVYMALINKDALVFTGGIVWDFNLFCTMSYEDNVLVLTHEWFHLYRAQLTSSYSEDGLMRTLDGLQNEGIADQIDKKSFEEEGEKFGYSAADLAYIDSLSRHTPHILKELDRSTVEFLEGKISRDSLDSKAVSLVSVGSGWHISGFYMSNTIKRAGLMDDMLRTLDNPLAFLELYNRAIATEVSEEYVLSPAFMEFVEKTMLAEK